MLDHTTTNSGILAHFAKSNAPLTSVEIFRGRIGHYYAKVTALRQYTAFIEDEDFPWPDGI